MSTEPDTAPGTDTGIDPNALRDSEDRISPLWLERLRAYLAAGRDEDVATVMEPLPPAAPADLLEWRVHVEPVAVVLSQGDRVE